ncbi:ATP-binding protein [Streptomyces sp. CAU 1734]|uniref:ATP-binding protein n=1 Tax=Streptomyces sp. CAU 1734 TaxID=3140360 RepID=UPI00326132CE
MKSDIPSPLGILAPLALPHSPTAPARHFRVQLGSTLHGAHLARRLVAQQLGAWGVPRTHHVTVALVGITAELAANAITHGRSPGRDFALRLTHFADRTRVEITDTRPDRLPPDPGGGLPGGDATGGRGLVLVNAFASRWGYETRDRHTKTVWAEVDGAIPHAMADTGPETMARAVTQASTHTPPTLV